MLKIITGIVAVGFLLYAYSAYIERKVLFYPMRQIEMAPKDVGLQYEDVYFKADDGAKLNGWLIKKEGANAVVLFCHGNAGNISHRIEKIGIFNKLGVSMFIFDYRGYGRSNGRPSEQGLRKDGLAAYNYIKFRHDMKDAKVVLYGESIGGGVAVYLASEGYGDALITEDTFTSIRDMTKLSLPFIPQFLIRTNFDSLRRIKDIKVPKLIIHALDDEIVPYEMAQRLFEAAPEPKEFLKLRGSHNTAFLESQETYETGLARFLKRFSR